MDSMMDDDPTLPIDFDQTSNFARFLNQSRKNSMQSDTTINEQRKAQDSEASVKKNELKKQRSFSSNDQPPERPLSRGTMREQENIISDLKKECFGLKMRIYFMEEQLSEAYSGDTEGTIKKNIELKVTIEEIKRDLRDKSDLLTQASAALEHMSLEKDKFSKQLEEKHHNQQQKMEETFEIRLQEKDEEIRRLQNEMESLTMNNENVTIKEQEIKKLQKSLLEFHQRYKDLETKTRKDEESLKSIINELEETIAAKNANIQSLKINVEKLADSPERSNQHYRKLYESQSKDIVDRDERINTLVKELAAKTNLSEGLKDHIVNMEKSIKGMRSNLHEKEMDKQRIVNQLQDRIKHFQSKCDEKENELVENREEMCKLKDDMKNLSQERIQFQFDSTKKKDARIVELDIMIKQQNFEMERLKALLEEKDKEIVYFNEKNIDLEEKWRRHEKSSSDLLEATKKDLSTKLLNQQKKNEDVQENLYVLDDEYKHVIKQKDKTIQLCGDAMTQKDDVIKNLIEITHKESEDNESMKDELIEKLQMSLRNKEKHLEEYKEENFKNTQLVDENMVKLKKDLREKTKLLKTAEEQMGNLKLQVESLQMNSKNNKTIADKMKNSIESCMENERETQLRFNSLVQQKEQEIRKLSSQLQNVNTRFELLETFSQDLIVKVPESNGDLEEMFKSLNESSNTEEISKTNWDDMRATQIRNQELLFMLKRKDNDIKELYQMLRDQEEEKTKAFEALNHKLLNTEQDIQVLSSELLTLKDVQQTESRNVEETIANKDKMIDGLVKSGKEKDRLILDLKENSKILRSSSPTKPAEMNKLRDQVDELRTKLDAKLDEIEKLKTEIGCLEFQLKDKASRTNNKEIALKNKLEESENICHTIEDEKIQLQAELGLAKLSIDSLESQLEGAQSRMSRQGTPDYKDSLMDELEDLVKAAEKEKAKYQTLAEKLQNNQHPESCLKLLKNEITEVEHLRRNLQGILLNVLKKQPDMKSMQEITNENKQLKAKLQQQMKIPDIASNAKLLEVENESLKNDLKRCEIEANQFHSQIDSMKNEYEQLVHERDREISHMTAKLDEVNKDKELIIIQRDQAKKDVIACQKQLESLQLVINDQAEKKLVSEEMDSFRKSDRLVVTNLQEENMRLKSKLTDAENDLKQLNETLMRMREIDIASLESKQNNVLEEKKQLKKDAKELCNINDRLRSKLKDLTKSYEILKKEKETEHSRLFAEIQKTNQTISRFKDDLEKQKNEFNDEKRILTEQVEEKTFLYNEVQNKYEATQEENKILQRKNEDLVKVNECHQTLTGPELQQLRDEVLVLTKENSQLKIEKLQQDGVLKETNTLNSALDESKHRIKALQNQLFTQTSQYHLLEQKINRLETELMSRENDSKHVEMLESDLRDMKKLKELLECQLKELSNSAKDMKEKVSLSRDEINIKEHKIETLQHQLEELNKQMESFSPIKTSSQQNISVFTDASTQTHTPSKEGEGEGRFNDSNLIAMHIQEMRELRKQLEETRKNNDALRKQLEDRLSHIEREAKMLNDPELKATLIRDNDAIRVKLSEAEASKERMKIKIDELTTEKQSDQITIQQLHVQLHELNQMSTNLKLEMEAYDRLVQQFGISRKKMQDNEGKQDDNEKLDKHLLMALLEEIRDLREQLAKSIDVNIALREKLEKELGRPVSISPLVTPSKDPTLSAKRSLFSAVLQSVSINDGYKEVDESRKSRVQFASPFETPTKDNSFSRESMDSSGSSNESSIRYHNNHHDACVLFGTWSNYRSILHEIEDVVLSWRTLQKQSTNMKQPSKQSSILRCSVSDLKKNLKKLEEINRLVHSFIPQDDKQNNLLEENGRLRSDIARLKKVLSSKEHFIQSALKMVEENALWKGKQKEDSSITRKLLKARDTLKATKGNLELKAKKAQETAMDVSFISSTSFEESKSPS